MHSFTKEGTKDIKCVGRLDLREMIFLFLFGENLHCITIGD